MENQKAFYIHKSKEKEDGLTDDRRIGINKLPINNLYNKVKLLTVGSTSKSLLHAAPSWLLAAGS